MKGRSWFDKLTTNGVSAAFSPVHRHGITTNGVSAAFSPVHRHGITTNGVSAAFSPVHRHGITTNGVNVNAMLSFIPARPELVEGCGVKP
jgi:protein tyrosine phosphatase (PTP) superfamily phosphohydrolase (DUF442 family)